MPTTVIMPALGMAQETGTLVRWLQPEGAAVTKGESIAEVMTDKATVELEAPATGTLAQVSAREGEEVPVGHAIALVLAPGEVPLPPAVEASDGRAQPAPRPAVSAPAARVGVTDGRPFQPETALSTAVSASPLALRLAAEHHLDLSQVPTHGRRIEKADILAYLATREALTAPANGTGGRLLPASPKARRLATEMGHDLRSIAGRGPQGAVLVADVLAARSALSPVAGVSVERGTSRQIATALPESPQPAVSHIWRIMAERTAQSWAQVPHFVLMRDVNASRLIAWRASLRQQGAESVTYTDLLVKLVAATLRTHPRLNSSWSEGALTLHEQINIGLAVAVDDGLVVPVVHRADALAPAEIAQRRVDLVGRAQASRLRPEDLAGATFTISNLGMYGVDAFNAIIVSPQAAILAVGRIADRVVPVDGVPAVQPMLTLTLSCDHRAVDGARGAQFLGALAAVIEEPLALLQ
jgi:pyruvate dehydrogenase E2 component (dihydrolipoyllysine-residue acetyltransferase)